VPDPQQLLNELVLASSKLATAAENASVILSEEHEAMTQPYVDEVRDIIARCPEPMPTFNGTLYDEDIEETSFTSPSPQGETRHGVNLRHKLTGIQRQSYTKPTEEENRAIARRALQQAVTKRFESLSK
jgi:hypothetical protein